MPNTDDAGPVVFGFGFGRFVAFWTTKKNFYFAGLTSQQSQTVINAAYSSDGINWTQCPAIANMISSMTPLNTGATAFTAAARASILTQITAVATGSGNSPLMVATGLTATGPTNQYLVSPNGINWSLKTFPGAMSVDDIAFGGGSFVAVGPGNVCWYTPVPTVALTTASIAFSQALMPTTASWSGVTYGNGRFVAVANNSATAANSPDGITWTQRGLPSSSSWNGVAFGNNRFIATANDGLAVSS
jgi:hypothetical protein